MIPGGPFDIIVMDPPWRFSSNSADRPGRNARRHYRCMRDDEIAALPVPQIVGRDALLFLWVTVPILERAMRIPPAWGFRYVSQLVWVKDRPATGFWSRNRHEPVLIYRRGKFPCPSPAPFTDSVFFAKKRQHSRKPEILQDRIDAVWPQARKLEMFARRPRAGWETWGNDPERFEAVGA
ncbi:MT-A70 family methyltransferase [Roseovarius sp. SYSU LYC5161]|uniref:MT-A70 family methyltransferase n=1 Tax=Roseovarius halophilus (ex Wu et al. 2025) TaxID=3376060 RepID=UPI00399C04EB